MAYVIRDARIGTPPIGTIDDAAVVPLGTIVQAFDPTYGNGEFIYLKGVASTVLGSPVTWDGTSYQTALTADTANQARPVAFATAAIVADKYGWYQIAGTAIAVKAAVPITPKVVLYIGAALVTPTAANGKQVLAARSANTTTLGSAITTVPVVCNRPFLQGQAA
jgi:hypothetical protein